MAAGCAGVVCTADVSACCDAGAGLVEAADGRLIGFVSSWIAAFTSSSLYSSSGVSETAALCFCLSAAGFLSPIILGTESFAAGGGVTTTFADLAGSTGSVFGDFVFSSALAAVFGAGVVSAGSTSFVVEAALDPGMFLPMLSIPMILDLRQRDG